METIREGSKLIACLKTLQLTVSVAVVVLFWLIYPGVMVLFASIIGLCYVLVSAEAIRDTLGAIWLAFTFSVLTAVLSSWGIYRYLQDGFDYFAGNFPGQPGVYWPAYVFVLAAVGSAAVVVLHALSWRWMIWPRGRTES